MRLPVKPGGMWTIAFVLGSLTRKQKAIDIDMNMYRHKYIEIIVMNFQGTGKM